DALTHKRELFNALVIARNGGESPLLDTLLMGTTFSGAGVVNGTTLTGAGALRASPQTRTNLANGAFGALMNTLNTSNTGVTLPPGQTGNGYRSEEHTSELQSLRHLVCRLLLEKKNKTTPTRRRSVSQHFSPAGPATGIRVSHRQSIVGTRTTARGLAPIPALPDRHIYAPRSAR